MLVFRTIVLLLLVAGLVCFALYIGTGQARWRALGIRIVKWTVIAALGFFAVLLLERIPL
jgi:predicted CDP-diglyceride synthetase/phosphatidate cytidylyltransferase